MRLTIISTVGASLLTNYARYVKADPWRFLDSVDDMAEEKLTELKKDLIQYLSSLGNDYTMASAELNSIMDILRKYDLSKVDEIELMFIISDTRQGRIVGHVLEEFFRNTIRVLDGRPIRVYVDIIKGLNYIDVEHATEGLPVLAARVAEWIKNRKTEGHNVIVNITGGFKAESIYTALIGLIAGVPVYYMHEKFRQVVQLPPIPESLISLGESLEIIMHMVKAFYENFVGKYKSST